jgi:type I restriction enzyme S subunit
MAQSGDVLICVVGATAGKLNLGLDCAIGRSVAAIRPSECLDQRFLYWYLMTWVERLRLASRGSAQGVIRKAMLENLVIPLPRLDEQVLLVDGLEDHLSRLQAADQSLESAARRIDHLLGAARAKLWIQAVNLGDTAKVKEVGEVVTGSTPSSAMGGAFGGDIPFITPADVLRGDFIALAQRSLSPAGAKTARIIGPCSVVAVCIGATLGKIGWVDRPSATNQQINAVDLDNAEVDPRFLATLMAAPQFQDQMRTNASSTTMPILNKSKFASLTLPLPDRRTQVGLADQFDSTRASTLRASDALSIAKARSRLLRQSLLHAAFVGEITPPGPTEDVEVLSGV